MKKGKKKIYIILFIVFLVIALVCAVCLMLREYRLYNSEKIYESLAEEMNTETSVEDETDTKEEVKPLTQRQIKINEYYELLGINVPDRDIDFDRLHDSISEDIYAWIYIPETNVDYPVFQHPTDNSYYLEHNIDGSEGYPGCIYTENYNSKDFMDPQTVIYGHNMRDGTMFSDLHKYEDEDFFDANRYVFIYTEEDVFVYKIFAAYQTDNRHQLLNYDFSVEGALTGYLSGVMATMGENVIIDRDTEYTSDSKVLTLSTCVMKERQFHLRYLVQALMVELPETGMGE